MTTNERTVLIAIDGSKYSDEAFNWFQNHYAQHKTDNVLLYHCICPSSSVCAPIFKGMPTDPDKDYGIQMKRYIEIRINDQL